MRALALLLLSLLAVARANVVIRGEVRTPELLVGSTCWAAFRTACRSYEAAVLGAVPRSESCPEYHRDVWCVVQEPNDVPGLQRETFYVVDGTARRRATRTEPRL